MNMRFRSGAILITRSAAIARSLQTPDRLPDPLPLVHSSEKWGLQRAPARARAIAAVTADPWCCLGTPYARRRRKLLRTTETLESAMAAAATMGESSPSAATGMAMAL